MPTRPPKPKPTFEVRFKGKEIVPECVPLRAISDALGSIQIIAGGSDAEVDSEQDNTIGLLNVKRGSAVFQCVARDQKAALSNIRTTGLLLQDPESTDAVSLEFSIRPISRLSAIARSLDCEIVVQTLEKSVLASVNPETYKELSKKLLIKGETSISGTVQRVGGATDLRCALRVPNRQRLLYCDVASRSVAQKLGEKLYEEVTITGEATWLQRTWSMFEFTIHSVSETERSSIRESLKAIAKAGVNEWAKVDDPVALMKDLRS